MGFVILITEVNIKVNKYVHFYHGVNFYFCKNCIYWKKKCVVN